MLEIIGLILINIGIVIAFPILGGLIGFVTDLLFLKNNALIIGIGIGILMSGITLVVSLIVWGVYLL